jgi:succinate dehydrogenase hydrophobic anchor subunit
MKDWLFDIVTAVWLTVLMAEFVFIMFVMVAP